MPNVAAMPTGVLWAWRGPCPPPARKRTGTGSEKRAVADVSIDAVSSSLLDRRHRRADAQAERTARE